ncbi:hypothetical protein [Clostridium botulinum]|nr:hypothetical protein [Clostridium botulinum]MCD3328201.1 hypothetical protein [Clostridium botulinum D/C]
MSTITNWGRIVSNLKWLIKAQEDPYFNLMQFCNDKNINYIDIIGFIHIGKQITNGQLNLSSDLKTLLNHQKELTKQLELLCLN